MTFCAVCGRKASHHITLTPSLRRNSDYMKQLVKRLKLSTRQADRFTSLPNPHICFRHFADGCVRMVDGRPKIACSKFLKVL
uniref:THAP-type domain-containing protein n=1 Tax=Heterorhabditis bacteriophora TaxID=37862 RepID=A0A1I7X220_HETBA